MVNDPTSPEIEHADTRPLFDRSLVTTNPAEARNLLIDYHTTHAGQLGQRLIASGINQEELINFKGMLAHVELMIKSNEGERFPRDEKNLAQTIAMIATEKEFEKEKKRWLDQVNSKNPENPVRNVLLREFESAYREAKRLEHRSPEWLKAVFEKGFLIIPQVPIEKVPIETSFDDKLPTNVPLFDNEFLESDPPGAVMRTFRYFLEFREPELRQQLREQLVKEDDLNKIAQKVKDAITGFDEAGVYKDMREWLKKKSTPGKEEKVRQIRTQFDEARRTYTQRINSDGKQSPERDALLKEFEQSHRWINDLPKTPPQLLVAHVKNGTFQIPVVSEGVAAALRPATSLAEMEARKKAYSSGKNK